MSLSVDTMRTIDHDLETFQRQVVRKGAFAKLDVATGRVVYAFGFT